VKKLRDVSYSFGFFSGGILSYAMSAWYTWFYVDELGLPTRYYSVALTIYGLWNAINDPLFGLLSDRTRTRWGRRKPYILLGAVPFGLSLVLLFSPNREMFRSDLGLFLFFVMALCVFDTFYTLTMLNVSAVLPEMYLGGKDRARVGIYCHILGILGAMISTVAVQPVVNALGYLGMAWIFAAAGILTMLLSAWGTRELYLPSEKPLGFRESIRATLSSRAFLVCVASVLLVETAIVISTSSIAFYSGYVLRSPLGVTIIMGTMFSSSILFSPLVYWIIPKTGTKNVYVIAAAVFALCSALYGLADSMAAVVAVSVVMGIGVAGVMIMPNLLYAEIIDEDQVRTGRRREGAFFGINALIMRLSVVIQGFTTAAVLERSGYQADAAVQSPSALIGIRVLIGLAPAVFCALAALVLLFYPIDRARRAEICEKVREMNPASD